MEHLYVGVCYKSQKADCEEINQLYSVMERASQHQVLIMGDFNFPHIDWSSFECDKDSESFLDLGQDCFLTQHVHVPTRLTNACACSH